MLEECTFQPKTLKLRDKKSTQTVDSTTNDTSRKAKESQTLFVPSPK